MEVNKKMNHSEQVKYICSNVEIIDSNKFRVDSKTHYVFHQQVHTKHPGKLIDFGMNKPSDEVMNNKLLLNQLSNKIYMHFYCGIDQNASLSNPPEIERDLFMEKLSKENQSMDGLDMNWVVYTVDSSKNAFAQKNGKLRWLQPNSYQFADPTIKEPAVNTVVHFFRKKENKEVQPVFYHVHGNEYMASDEPVVRFYWNTQPEGSPMLIKEITKQFNEYHVPFQFKCLNHPDLYYRNDSSVLYIPKQYLKITSILLQDIVPKIQPYLKKEIPWFTQEIIPGLSFAEDPGDGQSFGMSRSQAIAQALIYASHKNIDDLEEKNNFVLNYLNEQGMSINKIYLNSHTAIVPEFSNIRYSKS